MLCVKVAQKECYFVYRCGGFAVIQDETRLITGCSDNELRVWKITSPELNETENSEKEDGKRTAAEAGLQDDSVEKINEVWLMSMIVHVLV